MSRPASLEFPRGLILGGWLALTFLGPLAFVATWWGDCFTESCPEPSIGDGFVYVFDAFAWVALLVILASGRDRVAPYGLAALIGVTLIAQGVAGLLGVRGLAIFFLLLPAGLLILVGGSLAAWLVSGHRLRSARGSTGAALSVGCATYVVAYFAFFGVATAFNGNPAGLSIVALVLAAVAIVALLARRPSP